MLIFTIICYLRVAEIQLFTLNDASEVLGNYPKPGKWSVCILQACYPLEHFSKCVHNRDLQYKLENRINNIISKKLVFHSFCIFWWGWDCAGCQRIELYRHQQFLPQSLYWPQPLLLHSASSVLWIHAHYTSVQVCASA